MPWVRHQQTAPSGPKRKKAKFVPKVPKNPIFRAIDAYLNETRRHDFHLGIRIMDVSVYAKVKKNGKLSRIAFVQPNSTPIKVFARCRNSPTSPSSKTNASDILVREHEILQWTTLPEWLQETYGGLIGPAYTLSAWWSLNGFKFRFLDLPPELRICMYSAIAPAYIWPHIRRDSLRISYVREDSGFAPPTFGALFFRDPSGHRALRSLPFAATNRQIAREFAGHVRTYSTSHYLFRHDLEVAVKNSCLADCLRRISLGFPNWMYFRFLGYDGHTADPFAPSSEGAHISVLKNIDTLQCLNFHFQIAQNKEAVGLLPAATWDPWTTYGHQDGFNVSCQKTFVEFFFTFALVHIRHVPNVTFTGHVKHSTRLFWERVFRKERAGRRHDVTERMAFIMSLPRYAFPPPCICENPCTYWNIQGPHTRGYRKPKFSPHQAGYNPLKHDPFLYDG